MARYFSLLLLFIAFSANAFGADKPGDAGTIAPPIPGEAKAPAPKNTAGDRKFESTIIAVDNVVDPPQITLQNGGMTLQLKPDVELVREERGLVATDLQVGDTLCLIALKGQRSKLSIKEKATVTALNPMTINVADLGVLTLLKTDEWEFYRATPIKPSELKIGQTVAVQITLRYDGDIIPKRVAVVMGKPQPARRKPKPIKRKPKAPAAPKEKSSAGNN